MMTALLTVGVTEASAVRVSVGSATGSIDAVLSVLSAPGTASGVLMFDRLHAVIKSTTKPEVIKTMLFFFI
jgi:hypothetical protein